MLLEQSVDEHSLDNQFFQNQMRPRKPFGRTHALLCVVFAWTISGQLSVIAALGPPLRTGLWVTQKAVESAADPTEFEAAIRRNPHLAGVCVSIGWNEIEKEPGHPDFSAIDKTVAVLRRLGMKYELGLKPGVDTPAYVFQEGAQPFETRVNNPHKSNFGQTISIPVPWDPIYQRNFSRIIGQLGKRYAGDVLCVSVVLTCANSMSKEMHLPKTREDRAKWKAMGNYGEKLLDVYKKYTDEWAVAFPKQAISLHVAKVADLPPVFDDKVIDYGLSKYPARFTIQNCQLSGRKEDTGNMSYDLVQKYRDRAHRGFQSLAGFSHGGERMGTIEMAALNVVHAQGEYWELWHGDGMSVEISAAVDQAWREAKQLGYEAYRQKLMSGDKYPDRNDDSYLSRGKGSPRNGRPR